MLSDGSQSGVLIDNNMSGGCCFNERWLENNFIEDFIEIGSYLSKDFISTQPGYVNICHICVPTI